MPQRRRCGVLGDPISHSLSPVLHRAGYVATGLDWEYDARRVPAGTLADVVGSLGEQWRGLSLTMPLKREALPLAAEVSDAARLAGAANTLVRSDDLTWSAGNTDIGGARAALAERGVTALTSATILGGGATASSTGLALCDLGAREVRLLVRSADRAAETASVLRSHPGRPDVVVAGLDDVVTGDVVVSTIPAEAQEAGLVTRCADVPVLFEVLYSPWPTPLAAAADGRVLVSGLDLLVHQAALQFGLFTGVDAPLDAMRAAGEQALAARGAS
ncbi:shikimate dehydrogenase [Nocardioides sp. InS609-2]|uniref:shikimate dehydrogenase n=1 Tax=Nocardioides sp. InS609-2 TaxID=2760705 RepID=UPI0024A76940|nr:shikimate dehydrogenase [Nocardioides sp. InS609-2]